MLPYMLIDLMGSLPDDVRKIGRDLYELRERTYSNIQSKNFINFS